MKYKKIFATLFLFLVVILSTSGCLKFQKANKVILSDLQPTYYTDINSSSELRVALAIGLSPSQSIARYQAITNYLSQKLDRPVKLVQRKTYKEVDELIQEGQVDIAFVCSSSYVIGHENFGERLLAVPIINGSPYYQSIIIARIDSDIKSWSEVNGHSFAFSDPQSTSGALYALSKMKDNDAADYFSSYIFTFDHGNTITAVRDNLVEAGTLDGNAFQSALIKDPYLTNIIRIIDVSPQYANNPVVASPRLDEQTFLAIQKALLEMDDELGQEALLAARIEKFELLEDNIYDSVRKLVKDVQALGGEIYGSY